MTLLVECKQKALVDEIMTMENTSTEAMPGHYVTSIFSANTRSEGQSFQCLHTLRQGTCKSKSLIFDQYIYKLLHVGKETENHLDYHAKF